MANMSDSDYAAAMARRKADNGGSTPPPAGEHPLFHAAFRRDESQVRSLLKAGDRFTADEWTELVNYGLANMIRIAFEVGAPYPTPQAIAAALSVAGSFDDFSCPQPDEALDMCRALTNGADSISKEFANAVALRAGTGPYTGARNRNEVGDAPIEDCPEVVRFLANWLQTHGVNI